MFDDFDKHDLYSYCLFLGFWLSAPCACLYTYKIIGFGLKAAAVRAGFRPPTEDETCFGLVTPFYFWNCLRKASLLPILLFLIAFGVSTFMSCGNNTACFCLVYHLWKKGKKVNRCLMATLFFQACIFIWHAYAMSTLVDSVIPVSFELLNRMFHQNLYYTSGCLLSILVILSCVLYWVTKMNREWYPTSVVAASGAGTSLAILSDFSSILSNTLAVGIGGFWHIFICVIANIWSLGLMLAFVVVVETRPYPLVMALVQPMVFGIVSFLFSFLMYGTLDNCSLWDLKSAPAVFIFSFFCTVIDSIDPSVPQHGGAPREFILVGAIWDRILDLRNSLLSETPETRHPDVEFGEYGVEHVSNRAIEDRPSRKGGVLDSPSELDMTSGTECDSPNESEEIEILFGDK